MAASDDSKKTEDDKKTDDDKKSALKGLIKEAMGEFVAEREESGRTKEGKETAKKSGSIWDSIFS